MGHCGNAGGDYMDTILSLRRRVGTRIYRPSLTFILDGNHLLGEMKGRENNKPSEKYHPAIVALLKDKRIEGLKGGGYQPENNFEMSDLDDNIRKQLQAENPYLRDLPELYDFWLENKQEALGKRIITALHSDIDSRYDGMRNCKIDLEDGYIQIEHYKSIDDYLDMNISYCYWLKELFTEDLPRAIMDWHPTVSLHYAENMSHAVMAEVFRPLFRQLLPYDHDYKAENSEIGEQMNVVLNKDESIDVQLPINLYFALFFGPDSLNNRRYMEHLGDANEHRHSDLDEMLDIEDEKDGLLKQILLWLDKKGKAGRHTERYQQVPETPVQRKLVDIVIAEFRGDATNGFTIKDRSQLEFPFMDDDK
jgi:hypothetical protein